MKRKKKSVWSLVMLLVCIWGNAKYALIDVVRIMYRFCFFLFLCKRSWKMAILATVWSFILSLFSFSRCFFLCWCLCNSSELTTFSRLFLLLLLQRSLAQIIIKFLLLHWYLFELERMFCLNIIHMFLVCLACLFYIYNIFHYRFATAYAPCSFRNYSMVSLLCALCAYVWFWIS